MDAIDTVTGKLELIEQATKAGTRIISCMGAGNKIHADKLEVTDIYKTSGCPLARVMRYELRKRRIRKLKVVYSKEPAMTPIDDMAISCRQNCICPRAPRASAPSAGRFRASTAFVPAVAGLIIAGEVVKDLTGVEKRITQAKTVISNAEMTAFLFFDSICSQCRVKLRPAALEDSRFALGVDKAVAAVAGTA